MKNIFIKLFITLVIYMASGNAFARIGSQSEFIQYMYGEKIYLLFKISVFMLLFSPTFKITSYYLTLRNKGTKKQKVILQNLFQFFISAFPIYLVIKYLSLGIHIWLRSLIYDLSDIGISMLVTSPAFLIALIFLILCDKGFIKERKIICWLFVFYSCVPLFFLFSSLILGQTTGAITIF